MDIPWRWYKTHALRLMIQRLLGKNSLPSKWSHNCNSCSDGLWSSFNVFIWKKWISGWSGASGINWRRDDNCGKRERKTVVVRNKTTSSPSPMQLPSNVQADQFHLKPAKEISTHSMASSRLDKRERKRAFLFECKHDIIDQTRLKPESNLQEKEPGVYGVFDDF